MGIRTRIAIATAGVTLAMTGAASAAVTGVTNDAAGAGTLANTLPAQGLTIGSASYLPPPPAAAPDTPNAISDGALAGFPTDGSTFAILTNGDGTAADNPNANVPDADETAFPLDDQSVQLGTTPPNRGLEVQDTTVLQIPVTAAPTANCLSFDFRFLTDEWAEYAGGEFNDAFIAELDQSTWEVQGLLPPQIVAPLNFAFGPGGEEISVNTSGALAMSLANAAGTTYDGATPLLSAATQITPGSHDLFLSIFDNGDDAVDSAVFVDRLAIGFVPQPELNCVPGAQVRELDLTLTPAEGTAETGKQHTVEATLTQLGGEAIPDADIDFQVVGAQAASGARKTDANGVAEFAYPGVIAGEDAISACYDADNDDICEATASATATWTNPPEGPPAEPPAGGPVCAGAEVTKLGADGKDKLKGTKKADSIIGLAGNDKLAGKKGNDRICGGAGKDKLKGGPGNDVLKGNSGNDVLIGGPGQDKCVGGPGKERLRQC